jgi:hypothetical protein
MNNGQEVDQASGADVWLSDYSPNPALLYQNPMGGGAPVTVTMYWGTTNQNSCSANAGDSVAPAIEVALLKKVPGNNPTIEKYIFEASGCNRGINNLSGPTTGGTFSLKGSSFINQATLSISNGLVMKVIPIFNSSIVGFQSSGVTFPAQGSIVTSTGTSGDTVRKVVYFQSYPQLPLEVFPYSLLSQ